MTSKPKEKSKKSIQGEKGPEQWTLFLGDGELGAKINEIINGYTYIIITTIIMLYSLFSDDIRQIFFPQSADLVFSILTLICMIFYSFEIVIFSLFQKDYFLKYYFWLDLISTFTMAFDLIWITQYITGGGKNAANISQITKASRAARLGTRTVRLIRFVRMIRILEKMKNIKKDLTKTREEVPPKKISQRLSSIHSKLASLRNLERLSSLRHMQKLPSKRWSLIKETGCMSVQNLQNQGITLKNDIISISCLPYKEHDQIIDRGSQISRKSQVRVQSTKKVQSIKSIKSIQKISSINGDCHMILQRIEEQPRQDGKDDIYKSKKTKFDQTTKKIDSPSEPEIAVPIQTKVGSKVQQQIQKNVILMIILILISIPLLDGSTWYSSLTVYDQSINQLVYFAQNLPVFYQSKANEFIQTQVGSFLNPLLYFKIITDNITDSFPDNYNSYSGNIDDILTQIRAEDIDIHQQDNYTVAYDISWYNKLTSIMNIGRTFFVCILLVFTTMLFSRDLENAAIGPLEEMFDTVRKIAIHPLNALREIEQKNMCLQTIGQQNDEIIQNTEPRILQNTIVKIGSLLAVGFGEAGTQIICRVIEDPSIINVMIPGQKIMALFGFCDIRNFTDATEVLQADVMVFVNQIAQICHRVVYQHLGSPNKNIGDAFLLVWKFSQQDYKITETADEMKIDLIPSHRVSQLADLAVLAIVNMIAQITKSQALQKYKNNKGLQERIPNYAGVKMGFGLHVGWAIEGPIGSQYKIDASYLSPHVHMASRLQGATKAYGANMLITDSVYNLMTENKKNLRHIDKVIPTGETEIVNLYTVDLVPKHLFDEIGVKAEIKLNEKAKRTAKVCQNLNRKKLQQDIAKEGSTNHLWNEEDIKIMQQPFTAKFFSEWKKGFNSYQEGKWQQALAFLNTAKSLAPNGVDGPSQSIIKYIEENKGIVPQNWDGSREFD